MGAGWRVKGSRPTGDIPVLSGDAMTARRTLFFVAVPSCLANLLFCSWVLLGGQSLPAAWRWTVGVASLCAFVLLFSSSIAFLWTGGRQEAELARAARKDPLTGLANRFQAESRLEDALERSRVSGRAVGVVFCDLNDFKVVNDCLLYTSPSPRDRG